MRVLTIVLLASLSSLPGLAQRFSPAENLGPNIPTPQGIVERMLDMAHVKAGETVYDLGSGDGRVLITAVQKFGARAVGIEIDPDLCEKAKRRVQSLGLEDKISIVHGSALRTDLRPADVVTMYFLTLSNEKLRPNLEKMKPGTRVVSFQFPIHGWKALQAQIVNVSNVDRTIYLYEVGRTH
jgi:protein-L-isoaspartate O-methyltransferase